MLGAVRVAQSRRCAGDVYLECFAELVAHQIVQERIDACGQVVEDAGHVRHHHVYLQVFVHFAIDGDQTLRVERRPAQEERHHNGN